MENHNYCVYLHTNKTNGKKYVGITSRKTNTRWQKGNGYKRQKKFYAAISKYGWDGFSHEILFANLTLEEANLKEKELIKFYDSFKNGYNSTEGGDGSSGCLHTEDSKRRMSESRKGRVITKEWRQHLSEALKGRTCPTKGKRITESHKKKISEGLKEYYRTDENAHNRKRNKFPSKPVISEDKEFKSIKECAEFYHVDCFLMARWLSGDSFIPKEFVDKGLKYKDSSPQYVLCELKVKHIYYNGVIYNSLAQCSKKTGHCERTLKNWISGISSAPVEIYYIPVFKYKILN